jgi:alginate O-acetyltransferase complex protein AlgI
VDRRTKQFWLICSLTLNLGLLLFFKYANFFVDNANTIFQWFGYDHITWVSIALPIGISFYTFQTLTYSIDIYRNVKKPLTQLHQYMLYIFSFPQMIAGPIVRYTDIADQINARVERIEDKLIGFYRFVIGLSKKVLIANFLGEQADLIFHGDFGQLSTPSAWVGILAYSFQIYFDFAGYSDMAIGLGRMMGFKFPENFNAPYTARSISDFWRRWHITLSTFMRDYLYIPLGGNRVKTKARLYLNLWIVFILSGLWHGASWNFILWGMFHGCFLVLDRLFLKAWLEKYSGQMSVPFTFLIVVLSWGIFRLEDLDQALLCYQALFSFHDIMWPEMTFEFLPVILVAAFFSFLPMFSFGKRLQYFFFDKTSYHIREHFLLCSLAVFFLVICISLINASGYNPFIYFRF